MNFILLLFSYCVIIGVGVQCQKLSKVNATSFIKETEQRINDKLMVTNHQESSINTCGGIYTQPQFLIQTPNYPTNYANNLSCLFIFNGPLCEANFTLQFLDFNLEDSLGCVADRLEIKNTDVLCGIHAGVKTYVAKTGTLELTLITNNNTSARGFRILVSRSICLGNATLPNTLPIAASYTKEPSDTTTLPPTSYGENTTDTYYLSNSGGQYHHHHNQNMHCCAELYNAKRFFLASPGFPYNNPAQCSYTIKRTSTKVCRLRIHFHYFYVECDKGYILIDNKKMCGCLTDMKLTSSFVGDDIKTIGYLNSNSASDTYSGFAIEVIQDDCPKRTSPAIPHVDITQAIIPPVLEHLAQQPTSFNYYHQWTRRNVKRNLDQEVYEPIDLGFKPRIVKHIYFFASPDDGDTIHNYNFQDRDVEETSYIDTYDIYPHSHPVSEDVAKCTSWGAQQWNVLSSNDLWQSMPQCTESSHPSTSHEEEAPQCREYNFVKGYFQSPGYPYFYPKNLDYCYRFYKQPGFCRIRLTMMDFQLEDSYDCRKDFLIYGHDYRYCGQSLAQTYTMFDMTEKSYEEIRFITDAQESGQGFRGIYEQIPCENHQSPPYSTFTTTINPPTISSTIRVPDKDDGCLRSIKESYFTIDIYDYGKDNCTFMVEQLDSPMKTQSKSLCVVCGGKYFDMQSIIIRSSFCRLDIRFVTFDFPCEVEYVLIRNQKFCGALSGQMLSFDFEDRQIPIVYKRFAFNHQPGHGLKLHLVGQQSNNNCGNIAIPPAQRIKEANVDDDEETQTKLYDDPTMELIEHPDDVSVVLRKTHKEVCGIVMNVKTSPLSDSICNILLNDRRNVECSPISDNTIYVPYNNKSDKLELKFKNVQTVQDIEFKETTCDNKFIL